MTLSRTIQNLVAGLPPWVVSVPLNSESRIPLERWRNVRTPRDSQRKWQAADVPLLTDPLHQTFRGFDVGVAILTGPSKLVVLDLDVKGSVDGFEKCAEWISGHRGCTLEQA